MNSQNIYIYTYIYKIITKSLMFTYKKTLLHALLLLAFKIVESLQCILNMHLVKKRKTEKQRTQINNYFSSEK